MVTETTITQFEGWDPAGKPEFVRARKALQYSRSIDDFVRIMLDGNNGGYANDWLIGDNKNGEIALLELGLKNHDLKRTKDGCFFGANFPVTDKVDQGRNQVRSREERLIAQCPQKCAGTRSSPSTRGRSTSSWARRSRPTISTSSRKNEHDERTLCGRVEISPRGVPEWDWGPFYPGGTVQSKVIDGTLAGKMAFWGQIGHHGSDFIADRFLKRAQGIRVDARALEGHEMRAVDPIRGGHEAVAGRLKRWY